MIHIETIELASSAASITFSSIPQDYTDLVLAFAIRSDDNGFAALNINSSTSNFTGIGLQGNGSSASSFSRTDSFFGYIQATTDTANTFGNGQIYISNYTASAAKSISIDVVTENNATGANQVIYAGLWNQTAAINSVGIEPLSAGVDFVAGSTISLYGITAGGSGTVS